MRRLALGKSVLPGEQQYPVEDFDGQPFDGGCCMPLGVGDSRVPLELATTFRRSGGLKPGFLGPLPRTSIGVRFIAADCLWAGAMRTPHTWWR